ncbi:unnamed protein product [Arabidopsis halleri]
MRTSPRDSLSRLLVEILGKILSLVSYKSGLVDNLYFDHSMVVYPNKK